MSTDSENISLGEVWEDFRAALWGQPPGSWIKETFVPDLGPVMELDLTDKRAEILRQTLRVPSRLLIRTEYSGMLDYANNLAHNEFPECHGLVVLGQPGIGKSAFLAWALITLLLAKRPVIFDYAAGVVFGFNKHRVKEYPSNIPIIFKDKKPRIALVDAASASSAILTGTNMFIVFASPSLRDCYQELVKQRGAEIGVMDVWSPSELTAYAFLQGFDTKSVLSYAARYGPAPRTVNWALVDSKRKRLDQDIGAGVRYLVNARVWKTSLGSMQISGLSDVIWVRPIPSQSYPHVEYADWVPTVHIWNLIQDKFTNALLDERLRTGPAQNYVGLLTEVGG